MLLCIVAALLIGVIWESFEFLTGITNLPIEIPDTLGDISMDVLGGLLGYLLQEELKRDDPLVKFQLIMFYNYILQSKKIVLYILVYTTDLKRRLLEHNKGIKSFD